MKKRIIVALFSAAIVFSSLNTVCISAGEADEIPTSCPAPEEIYIEVAPEDIVNISPNDMHINLSSMGEINCTIDENGHTKGYITSFNPENYIGIEIKAGKTEISGCNSDTSRPYIMAVINNSSNETMQKVVFNQNSNGSFLGEITISSLSDGKYSLNLYNNSERYGTFSSWISNQIYFIVENGEAYFSIEKDVWENNKSFTEKNYRVPSYYLTQQFPLTGYYNPWIYTNEQTKLWADEITAGCKTDYEKIKAVHDWAADNIFYDYEYYEGRKSDVAVNPEDVYNNKTSVCQGYSDLCASLLRSIGIPCKAVEGYAKKGNTKWEDIAPDKTNHAWNEAWLADESRWVIFDSTWDSKNKYDYQGSGKMEYGGYVYKYFDINPVIFASDHRVVDYSRETFPKLGDFNNDKTTDSKDCALFIKHFTNTTVTNPIYSNLNISDVNGDGKIDFSDVTATLKKSLVNDKML